MSACSNLVALVVTVSTLCGVVGGSRLRDEDAGEDVKWVRMCTLTSHGGSAINATVPCGVRVRDQFAVREEDADEGMPGNRPDVDESTPLGHRYGGGMVVLSTLEGKAENRRHDSGLNAAVGNDDDDDGDGGVTLDGTLHSDVSAGLVAIDGDRAEELDSEGEDYDDDGGSVIVVDAQNEGFTVVDAQDDGVTVVDAQDDGSSSGGHNTTVDKTAKPDVLRGGDEPSEVLGLEITVNVAANDDDRHRVEETDDDSVTVVRNGPDDHQGHQRHGAVAKALLGYLLEARNRLHEKIHNLLNFLKNAFFNAKLYNRSRRNLAEQQMTNNGRRQGNKKKQSIASVILEPTFERSLMTMSFLMFGVFVIQVVQRLMQTLQPSGEMTSMGNPVFENLSKISSNIF